MEIDIKEVDVDREVLRIERKILKEQGRCLSGEEKVELYNAVYDRMQEAAAKKPETSRDRRMQRLGLPDDASMLGNDSREDDRNGPYQAYRALGLTDEQAKQACKIKD